MEVPDYSKLFKKDDVVMGRHSSMFPKNIMCIIAGSTGSGKSNLMCHLLKQKGLLNYADVTIYSSTLYQPLYKYLESYYGDIEERVRTSTGRMIKLANFYDSADDIIDPSTLSINQNHIMIFDDVMLSDQTRVKEYYCKGRHNNVSVFYLVQSLHHISKHCIRQNSNIFILFHQDDKTMKYFHETHISGDMDFKEFQAFYTETWSKKHSFIVINLWDDAEFGRYWSNYKSVYIPNKYNLHINK